MNDAYIALLALLGYGVIFGLAGFLCIKFCGRK